MKQAPPDIQYDIIYQQSPISTQIFSPDGLTIQVSLGGNISVTSKPGKGSEFTFVLPITNV